MSGSLDRLIALQKLFDEVVELREAQLASERSKKEAACTLAENMLNWLEEKDNITPTPATLESHRAFLKELRE